MRAIGVLTNKTPLGTFRGPGEVEATFARERMLDLVAARLSIDPVELRRRNLIPTAELPYLVKFGASEEDVLRFGTGDYHAQLDAVLEHAGYADAKSRCSEDPDELIGVGVACSTSESGVGAFEWARVVAERDGTFSAFSGIASVGQGLRTALAQVLADEFADSTRAGCDPPPRHGRSRGRRRRLRRSRHDLRRRRDPPGRRRPEGERTPAGRRAARRRNRRRRDRRRSRGRRRREREPRRAGCVRGRPLRAGRADPPLVLRGCRGGHGRSGHRQGHAASVYGWIRPGTRRQPARARRPVHRRRRPGDRRRAVRGVGLRRVGTTARGDLHGLHPAHDGRAARDRVARVRVPGARQPAGRQGRRQCRDHLHARGCGERRRRRARPRRRAGRLAPAARERGACADPRRRDGDR